MTEADVLGQHAGDAIHDDIQRMDWLSMYSVMTLLHFRASVCDEEDLDGARYSAQVISELPPMPSKSKGTTKARTLSTDETSWRATPQARTNSTDETSWRQALPVSSAGSWVAKQRNGNPADDENVTRAARSILNKLTVDGPITVSAADDVSDFLKRWRIDS